MKIAEGFIHAEDQTKLYFCHATPDEGTSKTAKSVLLLHGYGEHCRRYDHVMRALTDAGFSVMTFDFRGHGRSLGRRGFIRQIDEYLWDIDAALLKLKGSFNEPALFMAHSMGGASALAYVMRSPERVKALALSSPYLGRSMKVNPLKLGAGHLLGKVLPIAAIPAGLTGDMVSQDPQVQRDYETDKLNNKNATAGWFVATEALHERLRGPVPQITMPLLLGHGEQDPVASIDAARALFERCPAADKTFVGWPGLRHEPLNEKQPDRQHVIDKYVSWLTAHA